MARKTKRHLVVELIWDEAQTPYDEAAEGMLNAVASMFDGHRVAASPEGMCIFMEHHDVTDKQYDKIYERMRKKSEKE